MPRRSQNTGGTRVGAPGVAYPNRSDLNAQKNLPARVATGQTYGKAGQQLVAQAALPMAQPRLVGFPGAGPLPAGPGPSPGAPPPQAAPGGGAPSGAQIAPGAMGALNRPTERPGEPVTSGINMGAGPGAEALPQAALGQNSKLSDTLAVIARTSGSAAMADLASKAAAAGQ